MESFARPDRWMVSVLRFLSRLVFWLTIVVLSIDGLLLFAVLFPETFAGLPVLPELDRGDLLKAWPVLAWAVGVWFVGWLLTRDHNSPPGRRAADSVYARAIPRHDDLVDLLSGVAGSGARKMAASLLAGPHKTSQEREDAEKSAANWAAGAAAEEKAARLLKALGPDWTVLHDITVHHHGWNIDHMAIGPQGVFVINTKTTTAPKVVANAEQVTVRGWHTDYIAKSRHEAHRTHVALFGTTSRQLVTPVLLFVDVKHIEFTSPPGNVWIVEGHNVIAALTGGPVRLSPRQYGRLVAKARYQQTWMDGWERARQGSRLRCRYDL